MEQKKGSEQRAHFPTHRRLRRFFGGEFLQFLDEVRFLCGIDEAVPTLGVLTTKLRNPTSTESELLRNVAGRLTHHQVVDDFLILLRLLNEPRFEEIDLEPHDTSDVSPVIDQALRRIVVLLHHVNRDQLGTLFDFRAVAVNIR